MHGLPQGLFRLSVGQFHVCKLDPVEKWVSDLL